MDDRYNYGKLKNQIKHLNNIIYYKKIGGDEISINITNRCPNRCPFCIRDKSIGWGIDNLYLEKEPKMEQIIKELNNAIKTNESQGINLKKLKICGYGEPILRLNEFPNLLSNVNLRNFDIIQLTTTGWPFFQITNGKELLIESKKYGLNRIYLSLHSIDEDRYKKMLNPNINSRIAFKEACNFANEAKSIGLEVILAFIRVKTINEDEIFKFAKKLNLDYHIRDIE